MELGNGTAGVGVGRLGLGDETGEDWNHSCAPSHSVSVFGGV